MNPLALVIELETVAWAALGVGGATLVGILVTRAMKRMDTGKVSEIKKVFQEEMQELHLEDRFDHMETRFEDIDEKFSDLGEQIKGIAQERREGDGKLYREIEKRDVEISRIIGPISERLTVLENRVGDTGSRISKLEESVLELVQGLGQFKVEIIKAIHEGRDQKK